MHISPEEVRAYLSDSLQDNHLLDSFEFSDGRITLAAKLTVSDFNEMPPISHDDVETFEHLGILLDGICHHLFRGQMALSARNTMNYSDGGLQIPIEERYQYYAQMADMFRQSFTSKARDLKTHLNMESAWGHIASDYSTFPIW